MNRALFVAAVALTLAALVWGVSIVGGPAYARMEKNDNTRIRDLGRLGEYYRCVKIWQAGGEDTASRSYCSQGESPPPDLRDPLTDVTYAYSESDPERFQICATFEIGQDVRPQRRAALESIVFDGKTGCVKYVGSGMSWAQVRR